LWKRNDVDCSFNKNIFLRHTWILGFPQNHVFLSKKVLQYNVMLSQHKGSKSETTEFTITTNNLEMLPVRDFAAASLGPTAKFQMKVGSVCFS